MKAARRSKISLPKPIRATAMASLLTFLVVIPVSAQDPSGITEIELGCNERGLRCREIFAAFAFPDREIFGELLLSFEDATLLSEDSFEITAELQNSRSPELLSRLPRDTFIPDDFPVLIRIEPRQGAGLSFRRNWTLEVLTENLEFTSHTPFRLFRAPNGGSFQDVSSSLGSGSFRVRGLGASFSEFLIAADLRPPERVAGRKLLRLTNLLGAVEEEIGSAADDLTELLDQIEIALDEDDVPAAIDSLDSFIERVKSSSGSEIPDDTRPGEGVEGIAARLITSAETLQHSLFLGLESAQGGMSGFSRRLNAGGNRLELFIEFEDAYVVDPKDLDIAVEMLDVHDPAFSSRLPEGVHVPEEFPVLVRINPRPGADQAFTGRYEIEIQTESLTFVGGTPLRLFKAPDGGAFEDITRTYGLGSFRVRGLGASFSEFVIAQDMRPVEAVVSDKFDDLTAAVEASADEIPAALRQQLETAIAQARQNVEEGLFGEAIDGIETIIFDIEEESGENIPALWFSEDPAANVAGELISILESLIFSLELQDAPTESAPGDVNLDGRVDVGDIFFLIDQVFGDNPPPAELFLPPGTDDEQ